MKPTSPGQPHPRRVPIAALTLLGLILPHCADSVEPAAAQYQYSARPAHPVLDVETTQPIPRTSHIELVGVDPAGPLTIVDPTLARLSLVSNCSPGPCSEQVLIDQLVAPIRAVAHPSAHDHRGPFLITNIGLLFSADTNRGSILEYYDGQLAQIEGDLNRPACAEYGDLDNDGDLDVVVCEYGHIRGGIHWLEQQPGPSYVRHDLDLRPGAIHAFPADLDGDGQLEIASIIAQEVEEVTVWKRGPAGKFIGQSIKNARTDCYGLSSLRVVDIDLDGDLDLLVTNGDTFDAECARPEIVDLFGLRWYENLGGLVFVERPIVRRFGAYATAVADLDNDGDLDIALASHGDTRTEFVNLVPPPLILLNNGRMEFTPVELGELAGSEGLGTYNSASIVLGDWNNDGAIDLAAGLLHLTERGTATPRMVMHWGQLEELAVKATSG